MKTYSEFQPTSMDPKGLAINDKQDWLVHPCGTNRDADTHDRSNFTVTCLSLQEIDLEGNDHEVHRFGHWACGWFEIVIVRPGSACERVAIDSEAALADYPILDDMHHSELEEEEAHQIWRACYSVSQRIDYIRDNRSQFEFHGFADMLGCVRGDYFKGYASELVHS